MGPIKRRDGGFDGYPAPTSDFATSRHCNTSDRPEEPLRALLVVKIREKIPSLRADFHCSELWC